MSKPVIWMVTAIIIWGTTIPPTKWALEAFQPFTLTFLRLFLAGAFFIPLAWMHVWKSKMIIAIPWSRLWGQSFTGVAGYFALNQYGISLTSGVNASILGASLPLFTIILAMIFLKERITLAKSVGLILSVAGVLIISVHPTTEPAQSSFTGDLLVLVGCFVWAIYVIQMKRSGEEAGLTSEMYTSLILLLGSVMILPLCAGEIYVNGWPQVTWKSSLSVAFLALGPTVCAYWLWNKSLRHVSATSASAYLNALPLVNVVTSILFLGEIVSWKTVCGGCIVLLGVFFVEKKVRVTVPKEGQISGGR